jgi:hypothetical protein
MTRVPKSVLNSVRLFLLTISLAATVAAASQSKLQLRGSWRAAAGTRVLQGTWTADVNPNTPNLAQGSWTVIEGNRVLLQGTWAAERQRAVWRGAWSALVASGRADSPPITGTWQANVKDSGIDTLTEMLKRTAQAQIDGTWRRGQMSGNWSLVR